MKKIGRLAILLSLISCGRGAIPIIDGNQTSLIEQEQYFEAIEANLEKSLNRNPNLTSVSDEVYLRHLVVGFSVDVRFGLWRWRKSLSSGIEMHFNAPEVPYAN